MNLIHQDFPDKKEVMKEFVEKIDAAINKKLMQLTDIVDQFCFNHAIHLAVCDTLYKKNSHRPTNRRGNGQ